MTTLQLAPQPQPQRGYVGDPPSPEPPYTASAVHFDGATSLHIASLTATDNPFYSFVGWMKLSQHEIDLQPEWFTTDPHGNFSPTLFGNRAIPGDPGFVGFQISDASAVNSETMQSTASLQPDTWVCVIGSIDANAARKGKIYLGDVDVTDAAQWNDNSGGNTYPFTVASNGLMFRFGDDDFGNFWAGDFADWRIMPGVSLLNGSGDIPEATRRLFIDADGKPVDPAVTTAALGAPRILFSGDQTTFATNQGTGGVFTLTGSLTNASTSPSD